MPTEVLSTASNIQGTHDHAPETESRKVTLPSRVDVLAVATSIVMGQFQPIVCKVPTLTA